MTKDKQKHYLIYQTTNLVNGKIYIGKHETFNIEDNYFGSGKYLLNAINKHGIENFEFKILIDLKNKEELNLLEELVVSEEFCARSDTYNIKVGGDGGWELEIHDEKRKRNAALALKRKIQEMTDDQFRELQEQSRKNALKWHQNHPGYFAGDRNPMYGHVDSEETHKKRVLNHLGEKNSQYGKMWICNDLTRESRSILKTDPIPEGWRKGRICKK